MSGPDIYLSTVFSRSLGQVSSQIEGESVILNIKSGTYFKLNEVGSRIWELVEKPVTISALVEAVLSEFDVVAEQCQADVLNLVAKLEEAGLVSRHEGQIT